VRRLLGALLVSAVLLALIATVTELRFAEVADTLGGLDWTWVALSAAAYGASYWGRGLRLLVLMPGVTSLVHATSISARHILLAVVMPFRMGEASLPLMLMRECGRPLVESASVLGVMRVLDLLAVAIYLLSGLALTTGLGPAPAATGALATTVATDAGTAQVATRAALALGLLLAALLLMRPACRWISTLAGSPRKPLALLGRLAASVAALRTGQLVLSTLITLLTWAGTYGACWLLLRAMVAPPELGAATGAVSFAQSLVGTTGLHLSAVMPVSPIASLGTWELGWTTGYTLVGLPAQAAASSAIVSHVVIFAFIALIGAAGWLARRPPLTQASRSSP
jgi:glycosyltransferase 2 family protein